MTAVMLSSTSIQVTVLPLPSQFIHGIVKGYLVRYRRADEPLSLGIKRFIRRNQSVVNLTDLEEFTNYSVQASAVSSKGQGPFSSPFYVKTDEDGNLISILRFSSGVFMSVQITVKNVSRYLKNGGENLIKLW